MNFKKILRQQLISHKPILLFDGDDREGETDLVFYPKKISHKQIEFLRKNGGGLICLAISEEFCENLGLPFLSELLPKSLSKLKTKKTPYGDKPSFSISINHTNTFTGITDDDRAETINSFFTVAESEDKDKFLSSFYSPGHVFLLRSSKSSKRKGHTELSTTLLSKLNLTPIALLCEMLDSNGKALSKKKAKKFADKNGFIFLDGKELDMIN